MSAGYLVVLVLDAAAALGVAERTARAGAALASEVVALVRGGGVVLTTADGAANAEQNGGNAPRSEGGPGERDGLDTVAGFLAGTVELAVALDDPGTESMPY